MRIRTLALALALCFGSTALVQAAPAKQKTYKPKKQKGKRFKQSKASKVKPRKAKKRKPVQHG
jgi:hypothetical protein